MPPTIAAPNLANGSAILSFTQIPVGLRLAHLPGLSLGYITVNNGSGSFSGLARSMTRLPSRSTRLFRPTAARLFRVCDWYDLLADQCGFRRHRADVQPQHFNIGTASYTLQTVYTLVAGEHQRRRDQPQATVPFRRSRVARFGSRLAWGVIRRRFAK